MRKVHCTVLFSLLALAGGGGMAQVTPGGGASKFTVFLRGVPVGTEEVTVTRSNAGTTVSGSGASGAPINLTLRKAEIRYDQAGRPVSCYIEGSLRDRLLIVWTQVSGTTANSEVTQGSGTSRRSHEIAPDSLLLASLFFGSYEALAARLPALQPGTEVPVHVPGQAQISARLISSAEERIRTLEGTVEVRRFRVLLTDPKPFEAEVWSDQHGRLARLSVADQGFDVVRSDIATVAARREPVAREGDLAVSIPANGFALAGTLSRPAAAVAPKPPRLPAVVLVGGTGQTDRDESIAGIPVLGQLANALADAGFVALRYDRRGSGQSGGRQESAGVADYADDVRAAVRFLRRRRDVDERRLAVLGYGEGGLFAMLAASRDEDIKALALAATPGVKGTDLVMEQQRRALEKLTIPEAEKSERVALQQKINDAVLTGKGWEGVPPATRSQAETTWFRSLLAFDPAAVVRRVEQPVLILGGALDTEVETRHAESLAALAKAREKPRGDATKLAIVSGVNHLLVPAEKGTVEEYADLADKTVSPAVVSAVADWLRETLPPRTK